MRGQLFISDVLVSIIVLTIIIAFTTWEAEQVYTRAADMQYDKMNSLANDMAQLAVKSILANRTSTKILPNWVDRDRWSMLQRNMSQMIKPPYAYYVNISDGSMAASGNGGCDTKSSVVVVKRIVYIIYSMENKGFKTFTLKVCI